MRKIVCLWLGLFVALLILAGCGTTTLGPQDGVIRYVLEQEPTTLDPAKTSTLPEASVQQQIYEGLTRLGEDGEPIPAAAERWDVSSDGLVYTFHLRPHMEWSNGDPLGAEDFQYAWMRVLNPEEGADASYMLYPIKGAEAYNAGKDTASDVGIRVIDHNTLQVTLEQPAAYFPKLLAFHGYYPVHKASVEASPNWATRADTIIGNGPFVLTKWQHSAVMKFAKNDKYWNASVVKTKAMEWPISESQSTRLALVEGGEADMMVEPPVPDQQRLQDKGLLRIGPMLGTYYYVFNVTAEPVKDKRVRQALSMVINRKAIVDHVVHGGKIPAFAFVPPGMMDPATNQDFRTEGGPLVEENIPAAKALLQEAGYDEHHPLPTITILFNTNEMHKAIAEAVQEAWKQAFHCNVVLQNEETKVFLSNRNRGNFEVARASWIADYADPQNFLEVFSASDNDGQYHNPAYNALLERIKTTQDVTKRWALMHEAEQMLFDDATMMPIYFTAQPYVTNGRIHDYYWTALGTVDFTKAYKE